MRLVSIPLAVVVAAMLGSLGSAALLLAGLSTGNGVTTVIGAAALLVVALLYGIAQLIREQSNAQILALAELAEYLGADTDELFAPPNASAQMPWEAPDAGFESLAADVRPGNAQAPQCGATRPGHPGMCRRPVGHSGPHSAVRIG